MFLRSPPICKIISISPGGFKGFYQLGIGSYIKENYYTDKILFTGASAGAWVSLMMVYKGDHKLLINNLIKWTNESTEHNNQLNVILQQLKTKIIVNYKTHDFIDKSKQDKNHKYGSSSIIKNHPCCDVQYNLI
jgi:hypothetical protein